MALAMTKPEREAFLADVHVGIISIPKPGRGLLTVPVEDRKSKRRFRPAAATARLRRQPLLARGAGSAPSTRRPHTAAAHSNAWRG